MTVEMEAFMAGEWAVWLVDAENELDGMAKIAEGNAIKLRVTW